MGLNVCCKCVKERFLRYRKTRIQRYHIALRLFLRIPSKIGFREAVKFESRAFGKDEDEDEEEEEGEEEEAVLALLLELQFELELLRVAVNEDPTPPPPPEVPPPLPSSSKCDPFKDPSDAAAPNESRLLSSKPNLLASTPL